MTEAALPRLPIFAADPRTPSRDHTHSADRDEELIDRYADGRRGWTQGPHPAGPPVLVGVFYGFPACAVDAVGLRGRFPPFIDDLARLKTAKDRRSESVLKATMRGSSAWLGQEAESP